MTRPGQPMNWDQAFRLALVVERRARADATTWVARLSDQARLVARGRAEQVIEPSRIPDPLRTALSREWYVRVVEDHVRTALGKADPAVAVTGVETEHVAERLRVGVAYRIHGPGGSVVLNPDGPEYTSRDSSAADVTGESGQPARPDRWHREELERLVAEQEQRRADDARMVGATGISLTPDQRTAFAVYFHERRAPKAPPTTHSRPAYCSQPTRPLQLSRRHKPASTMTPTPPAPPAPLPPIRRWTRASALR